MTIVKHNKTPTWSGNKLITCVSFVFNLKIKLYHSHKTLLHPTIINPNQKTLQFFSYHKKSNIYEKYQLSFPFSVPQALIWNEWMIFWISKRIYFPIDPHSRDFYTKIRITLLISNYSRISFQASPYRSVGHICIISVPTVFLCLLPQQ